MPLAVRNATSAPVRRRRVDSRPPLSERDFSGVAWRGTAQESTASVEALVATVAANEACSRRECSSITWKIATFFPPGEAILPN